ncbi:MAG: DNA polymerase III subunit alpha [Deltaproteobacteria bacterium]|nr:DNA polymerase III subunit alpha [Deltaproteobacteria bacterium]
MAGFTHLHLHTQYSLLDGAIRLDELFPKAMAMGMKQVAMTDHGNLFGALDFYVKAREHGCKPILGCETYVAEDRFDRSERRSHHLVLLAKNLAGWKNLSYLNSMGFLEGFYYNPRIDRKLLRERSEGLIGLSACLGGAVPRAILAGNMDAAIAVAREYDDILGRGNYFLEVQSNGLPDQEKVNPAMIEISKLTGIPLVATNDCHYLERKDARAHEVLMCVGQKTTIADSKRMLHPTDAYYLRSPEEMAALFADLPEAIENTERIAKMCNVELVLGETHLPRFQVPEGYDADSYLAELAHKGLEERLVAAARLGQKPDPDLYRERLEHELAVVRTMNFSGYFLIVWDFIHYAKSHDTPVGPGRGSGAGSLVAYAVRITDIDPIANKLLFERFLNPERLSMPDFDVDFCKDRREEVIRYVTQKYGKHNVGQIVTMHQLKARSCVRDVARALGMTPAEGNRVATLVPEPIQGKSPPLAKAIAEEPRLKELYDGQYRELLDIAMTLEGLNRHAGTHAAGIVIGEKPLWEYVPCFRPANQEGDTIATQFNMTDVEKVGLVKFDFLGLTNLTAIKTAVDLINASRAREGGEKLDITTIPLDDKAVYAMLSRADVTGVFQFESSGFRDLLKKLKPDCFEDIVAAGALYRPGPIEGGMVDDFVERKHGRKKVEYAHPALVPILKDTYGVIVYQEQVMQISSALGGYSLGQADLLRRAMGKKKVEVMAKDKANFLQGAKARLVDPRIAEGVFDLMAKFAGYGFNRSHSAAYGLITYQTAYLKCHFPVEFFAGLLTCHKDKTEDIVKLIAEARAQGIPVLRPDINESDADFTVVLDEAATEEPKRGRRKGSGEVKVPAAASKAIRFGLAAVKGVGEGAVEVIRAARAAGGPFLSLTDFCLRVDTRKVNRKVIEALVKAGACDGFAAVKKVSRAKMFSAIGPAIEAAAASQRERESGQTSLLALLGGGSARQAPPPAEDVFAEGEEWTPKQLLVFEKESLGFYISGHPLDRFARELRRFANATTVNCGERGGRAEVILGGVVSDYQERVIKNGTGKYAFFKLEDQHGQIELHVASSKLDAYRDILTKGDPLLVTGTVDVPYGDSENPRERLRFVDAKLLASIRAERSTMMDVRLNADLLCAEQLVALQKLLRQFPGGCRTRLRLEIPQRSEAVFDLGEEFNVEASDELLAKLEQVFGDRVATLR